MNWYLSGITFWLNVIGHIYLFFCKKKGTYVTHNIESIPWLSLLISLFLVTKPQLFSLWVWSMSKIYLGKILQHFIQYTHPTENKINAATEANPNPVAEVSTISMSSRFLLKYWPTIKVAGSLVIATPIPEKKRTNL